MSQPRKRSRSTSRARRSLTRFFPSFEIGENFSRLNQLGRSRPLRLEQLEDRRLLAVQPFPTPLEPSEPLGSLIYETSASATIDNATETETFTIDLEAGQTLSALASPQRGLDMSLELLDPAGSGVALANNQGVSGFEWLQSVPVSVAGTYSLVVSGVDGTTGTFSTVLLLNAAIELEDFGGPANNSFATAQDLGSSFIAVGDGDVSRGGVFGRGNGGLEDWYQFALADGESASLVAATDLVEGTDLDYRIDLFASDGVTQLATGQSADNVSQVITNFVDDTNDGADNTYFVRLTNVVDDYQMLITRNATFDSEPNSEIAAAQLLGSSGTVLGYASTGFAAGGSTGPSGPVLLGVDLTDGESFLWDIRANGNINNGSNDAFDGGLVHAGFPNQTSGDSEENGREIVLGPAAIGTIEVSRKVYVSEDQGFARFLEIVTNKAGTTQSYTVPISTDLGSDSGTIIVSESSGDGNFTTADNWIITDDTDGTGDPTVLHVIADDEGLRPSIATAPTGAVNYSYNLSLAPGETQIVMHFAAQSADRASAAAKAAQLVNLENEATAGLTPEEAAQIVNFSGPADRDSYQFNVVAGDVLTINTTTPGDGPGEFVNTLDPELQLFDPNGNLVPHINVPGNETLKQVAVLSGSYLVQVDAEATNGEYLLAVEGNTGGLNPFVVTASAPANDTLLNQVPQRFQVEFSNGVRMNSIEASDLLIDGTTPATAVTVVDGKTLEFTLPGELGEGTHTVTIAAGSLINLQNQPVESFTSQFDIDSVAPRVTVSSLVSNQILEPGELSFTATFSERMNAASIDAADVLLVGEQSGTITPTQFSFNAGRSVLALGFAGLVDDRYTLTLFSGEEQFEDTAGNTLDGEASATTVPSGDGTAGGDFVLNFQVDATGVIPFPTPLVAKLPAGSLIYDPIVAGAISNPTDTDVYSLPVDAGQTLSVLLESNFRGVIDLLDNNGNLVASAQATGTGESVVLQTVPIADAQTYQVVISSLDQTVGTYEASVTLNAALERELHGGDRNNTPATAQDLSNSFIDIGSGDGERGAVLGQLFSDSTELALQEGFESGTLGPQWSTYSSLANGRIAVNDRYAVAEGNFALLMDQSPFGDKNLNEAILTVDLDGQSETLLTFSHTDYGDEDDLLPASFIGHYDGDGVSISEDGTTWHTVLNATSTDSGVWQEVTIDLAAAAETAGITLGAGFQIKFQQFDDYGLRADGRGYDDITITQLFKPEDWYRFTLLDGESASLAATSQSAGRANVELYAGDGSTRLAAGVTAANVNLAINNYVDLTTDGLPNTYYARVTGLDTDYSLVVTRNADFDIEANNDFDNPQDLTGIGTVLGHVTGANDVTGSGSAAPALSVASRSQLLGGATTGNYVIEETQAEPKSSITLPYNSDLTFEQAMALIQPSDKRPKQIDKLLPDATGNATEELFASSAATISGPLPILQQFPGPDSSGSIPPDPIAAAGPEQIVTMVNTDIAIYDKTTGNELFRQSLNGAGGFFGSAGATTTVFDPWILFDPDTDRFFAIGIDIASNTESNLFIAVSTDATPTSGNDWHKYKIDFTDNPTTLGTGPHFGDYPKLGVSNDAIYISGNYFAIDAGSGVYAGITAFEKAPLLSGGPVNKVYEEFFSGFSVFPLTQYDDNETQYFAETSTGTGSTVRIHTVTDVLGTPSRSVSTLSVPSYAFPEDVPQLGGRTAADSIDARTMTGVLRDGSMWFAHAISDPAIGDGEAVARWYEVDITGTTPILIQSGNVDPGPGIHAWLPAVAVDGNGNLGIGFSIGGPNQFFSAGFTGRLATDPLGETILPVTTYAEGTANYEALDGGGRNRWGDYTGLSIDPADDATFWAFNEYAATSNRWVTEVAAFQLQDPVDDDWYSFEALAGDALTISTSTPATGPLEFVNLLDAGFELFDPSGASVAFVAGSGNQTHLQTVTASNAGQWRVRVFAEDITQGEYVLDIAGASGANAAPQVIDADPDSGTVLTTFPSTYTLDFSETLLASSVQASDLLIEGLPAVGVTAVDGDTYTFEIDPAVFAGDGVYTVTLASGLVADLQGNGNLSFDGTFTVDTTGPQIVSTSWNSLAYSPIQEQGELVFQATFNETLYQLGSARRGPFAPAGDDVLLRETSTGQTYNVNDASYDPVTSIFTATYDSLPEGEYELTLVSGDVAFEDVVGNNLDGEPIGDAADGTVTGDGIAGGNYVIEFSLDRVAAGPVVDPVRTQPLGGLVFRSQDNTGLINTAFDTDEFLIDAQAGELLTIVVSTEGDTGSVFGSFNGEAILSEGDSLLLKNLVVTTSGLQTLSISGEADTRYQFEVLWNASLEAADGDSSEGNLVAIDSSRLPIANGRYAVLGSSDAIPLAPGRLFATPLDDNNSIVELDPGTGQEINRFSSPIASQANSGMAYNGSSIFLLRTRTNTLYQIDPDTALVLDTYTIPGSGSYEGLAAIGRDIYITDGRTNDILVFNPASGQVVRTLDIDGQNAGVLPTGGLSGISEPDALITSLNTGEIAEIDPVTGIITDRFSIALSDTIGGAAVIGGQIYVGADLGNQAISVYERDGTLLRTLSLPYYISALAGDDINRIAGDLLAEPNDTIATSTDSAIGPEAGAYVGAGVIGDNSDLTLAGLDVDLIEIRLGVSDRVVADIDAAINGSSLDPILTIFNADGTIVAQNDDSGSLDSLIDFTAAIAGTYYVGVSGFSNFNYDPFTAGSGEAGSTGPYDLTIDITNTGLISRLSESAMFSVPDVDFYSLDLAALQGEAVDIVLAGQAGADFSGQSLELINAYGNVLATATANWQGETITNYDLGIHGFTLPADEIYYVRLTSRLMGEYGLVVTPSSIFEIEPNNATFNLRSLNSSSTGGSALGMLSQANSDRRDYYEVSLTAGEIVVLTTSTPFDADSRVPVNVLNPAIILRRPDGSIAVREFDTAPDGKNAIASFTADVTGVYQVEVQATFGEGEYILDAQIGTPLTLPGDYNDNGTVDAADYTVWRDNLGTSATIANDSTPGSVTQDDYDVWKANFGAVVPFASVASQTTSKPGEVALSPVLTSIVEEPAPVTTLQSPLFFVPERLGDQRTQNPSAAFSIVEPTEQLTADENLLLLAIGQVERDASEPNRETPAWQKTTETEQADDYKASLQGAFADWAVI